MLVVLKAFFIWQVTIYAFVLIFGFVFVLLTMVIAIGEIKSRRGDDNEAFSNEEKGAVDAFLSELLLLQPHRTEASAFLTDGKIIQFFRLFKTAQLHYTAEFNLSDMGFEYLMGLLQMSPAQLGLQDIQIFKDLGVTGLFAYFIHCNKVT